MAGRARPRRVDALREPPVQHRRAAGARHARRGPGDRPVGRDGAARGRRAARRAPRARALRRGEPARRVPRVGVDRAPRAGLRVLAAPERRLGARAGRPARGAAGRRRRAVALAGGRRVVRRTAQDDAQRPAPARSRRPTRPTPCCGRAGWRRTRGPRSSISRRSPRSPSGCPREPRAADRHAPCAREAQRLPARARPRGTTGSTTSRAWSCRSRCTTS